LKEEISVKHSRFVTQIVLAMVSIMLTTFTVLAQPAQIFVSARNGVDGNPCTLALPCRTLASAHSIVAAGGRVIVDSGDYAEVTVTKSILSKPRRNNSMSYNLADRSFTGTFSAK
jgi:hypothetical protein